MGCSDSRTPVPPRIGCPSAKRYRRYSRRTHPGLPGSWGTFVLMPCSQTPVSPLRLTFEDGRRYGELLLPTVFTWTPQRPRRCLNPHHGHLSRRLVALGCCLPLIQMRRLSRCTNFGAQSHGLFTRCLRFAAFLPGCPVVRPRKTHFQLVVNLGWVGLATHQVPNEVSVFLHLTSPSSRLCLAQWSSFPQ